MMIASFRKHIALGAFGGPKLPPSNISPNTIVAAAYICESLYSLVLVQRETAKYCRAIVKYHTKRTETNGMILYYFRGKLHRFDGPAAYILTASIEIKLRSAVLGVGSWRIKEFYDATKTLAAEGEAATRSVGLAAARGVKAEVWMRHGHICRDKGPAVRWSDGTTMWVRNNLIHRTDGPAVEWSDGSRDWCRKGLPYYNRVNRLTMNRGDSSGPHWSRLWQSRELGWQWHAKKWAKKRVKRIATWWNAVCLVLIVAVLCGAFDPAPLPSFDLAAPRSFDLAPLPSFDSSAR